MNNSYPGGGDRYSHQYMCQAASRPAPTDSCDQSFRQWPPHSLGPDGRSGHPSQAAQMQSQPWLTATGGGGSTPPQYYTHGGRFDGGVPSTSSSVNQSAAPGYHEGASGDGWNFTPYADQPTQYDSSPDLAVHSAGARSGTRLTRTYQAIQPAIRKDACGLPATVPGQDDAPVVNGGRLYCPSQARPSSSRPQVPGTRPVAASMQPSDAHTKMASSYVSSYVNEERGTRFQVIGPSDTNEYRFITEVAPKIVGPAPNDDRGGTNPAQGTDTGRKSRQYRFVPWHGADPSQED